MCFFHKQVVQRCTEGSALKNLKLSPNFVLHDIKQILLISVKYIFQINTELIQMENNVNLHSANNTITIADATSMSMTTVAEKIRIPSYLTSVMVPLQFTSACYITSFYSIEPKYMIFGSISLQAIIQSIINHYIYCIVMVWLPYKHPSQHNTTDGK